MHQKVLMNDVLMYYDGERWDAFLGLRCAYIRSFPTFSFISQPFYSFLKSKTKDIFIFWKNAKKILFLPNTQITYIHTQ